MAASIEARPDGVDHLLRELAVQQGLAYSAYGDALQRFGEGKVGWSDLLKTIADLYFKGATQSLWGVVLVNASAYAWLLSLAGAKVLQQNPQPQPSRGRR
jgi:hypothetical protein